MGIELPPELADVAARAGVAWPEADEEAMARSAQAWREAATSMATVATDADNTVRTALDAVRGGTGRAAGRHWQAFVEPDSGHLTSTVRGMNDAADRLEHAAQQVGAAKVEIVRNLVALAQNTDAANSAATAGHPMALAGLDTAVRGTSANVADIEANLIKAVRPGSGVDVAAVVAPVNANPGTHGPGLVEAVAETSAGPVDRTAGPVAPLDGGPGPVEVGPGGTVGAVPGVVAGVVDSVGRVTGDGGPGEPPADVTGPVAIRPADLLPGDQRPGQGPVLVPGHDFGGDEPTPPTGTTVQAGFDSAPAAAGPLPPGAPSVAGVPAAGGPGVGGQGGAAGGPTFGGGPGFGGGGPGGGGGVAGMAPAPGAAAAGAAPAGARPVDAGGPAEQPRKGAASTGQPGTGQPGAGKSAGLGQPAGQPAVGRAGAGVSGTAHPVSGQPGPPVTGQPGAGRAGGGVSGTGHPVPAQPGGQAGVAQPGGQAGVGQPGTSRPGPDHPAAVPPAQSAAEHPGQPVVRERDEALALFWVHMFPIGHMPVAAARPARQVPPPPEEFDYAAGLRFEPGDHPRADLVDGTGRRAELRAGAPRVDPSEPLTRDEVADLAEGHDPLGGQHEREWDPRYQVRFGRVTAEGIRPDGLEFAWPPGEQYPEGGSAPGEAEVLDAGTEIDRFGTAHGRVFADAGTPFARRSLPPALLDQGYRRYRVLRPLPVWRAVSAAWFAQPGGGVRYRSTHSAVELVALGYLADVTREDP